MALKDFLPTFLRKTEVRALRFEENSPVGMPVSSGIQAYIANWAETGRYITPEIARSSPSVHACTMLISQSIARMEWRVLLDTGKHQQPIREHPLYALLNVEPNPFMGALTWRQSMLLDCLLYGNGYSFIERDASGRPIRLEKLRPDLMTAMRAPDNSVVYAYAAGLPGARTFAAYDIFHLIGPSADGLIGEPPIYLARQLIGIEIEAESFVSSFFQNGARPAGVLQVQGQLSPEAFARLKESWQSMQGGARNAGRIAILEAGYEFKQISVNPEDAQLIELRRYCREQIAAAFGVPPHMVGDSGKQSYASAEQADLEFTKHTLGTWASRLEEEASRKLVRPGERITTSISFDALTRGDMGGRFSAYATALQHGFLTINEIRAREGLAPVPGGEHIRAPLNLGPRPVKVKEPTDTPTGPDATAQGIGQLQAITALAATVAKGEVPAEAASGIIAAAFPLLDNDAIAAIIEPLAAKAAQKPPQPPPPSGPPTAPPPEPKPSGGEPAPPDAEPPTATPPTGRAQVGATIQRDCGTGSGGFQPGNDCGGGGADGGASDSSDAADAGKDIPAASELKTVKTLGGSTGAKLAVDADGNQFVVKGGNSPEHVRSEAAANDIYRAAGAPVPDHRLDESNPSQPKQITRFVDGKPLGAVKGEAFEKAAAALREDFATDALVANWDVIGMSRDNVLVPNDGSPPMRVDNGGSLAFRAQGGPKAFGPKVGELDTLRTSDQGRAIFGKLTDGQVASQIKRLAGRRASIIKATPEPLREVMGQRLDYMERWAKERGARAAEVLTIRIVTEDEIRACVADKIKVLKAEGYDDDQALAIALDYCGADEERDCGTGSGGFQPGNECGKGGGSGGAADGGKQGTHDIKLPRDPKRLTIDQADAVMKQLGYKLESKPSPAGMTFKLTDSSGKTDTVDIAKLRDMIYKSSSDPADHQVKIPKPRRDDEEWDEERDCGTGSGGFQPGNDCGGGKGGGGDDSDPSPSASKKPGDWMEKKGYPKDAIKTAGDAKLYACLVAKHEEDGLSKSEAKKAAANEMKNSSDEAKAKAGFEFGINMSAEENQVAAKTLKNDPGIYAKEKAVAAGLIKAAASGSQANVPPLQAKPTAPPAQQKHEAPKPVTPPKDPTKEPAKQAPKTEAGPSATPGKPPVGILPTDRPKDWESAHPTPVLTETQKAVVNSAPIAKEAVDSYSGSGYSGINAALRQAKVEAWNSGTSALTTLSKEQAMRVAALDVVTRVGLREPPPSEVYRGVKSNDFTRYVDSLGVGQTFTDSGFVSTSTEWWTANNFGNASGGTIMKIKTRQGLSIKAWSSHSGENEVLLPRGSRFKITSKEWRYTPGTGARLYIEAEHVETN